MTAEEYLKARGWSKQCDDAGDGHGSRWKDPLNHNNGSYTCDIYLYGPTIADAVDYQVRRDLDCTEFVAAYQAQLPIDATTGETS